MKLLVISPQGEDPREIAVLKELFAVGLERYHVRKPEWSAAQLEKWLRGLPFAWRPRLVLHQHHPLVAEMRLGGRHWRDDGQAPLIPSRAVGVASRSCHDLAAMQASFGRYDYVLVSPIFPSISKSGHGAEGASFPHEALAERLRERTAMQRRTAVFALGGITARRVPLCRELGFDGVALHGAMWRSSDPMKVFNAVNASLNSTEKFGPSRRFPVMCITQDGLSVSHVEQAERLCHAGARWIQLRMKNAAHPSWLATACSVVAVCRAHDAVCIVNDSVDIALAAEADGVHLGKLDQDWIEARRQLGPDRLLGGTVNDAADAVRAREAGCLDYVGVGPLRFTPTKQVLASLLGIAGVRNLIEQLDGLPAWVIGGVEPADLQALRRAGAAGAAVSSSLFRDGRIEENLGSFLRAWGHAAAPSRPRTHGTVLTATKNTH